MKTKNVYAMKRCSKCNKELRWYNTVYSCALCGKSLCGNCVVKCSQGTDMERELMCIIGREKIVNHPVIRRNYAPLCPSCVSSYGNMINKLRFVMEHRPYVEFVSENYHGKKSFAGKAKFLRTPYYKDWNDAKDCLRTAAAFYDCNMLLDVGKSKEEKEEETERGGTHYYSVWSFYGYAVKKK